MVTERVPTLDLASEVLIRIPCVLCRNDDGDPQGVQFQDWTQDPETKELSSVPVACGVCGGNKYTEVWVPVAGLMNILTISARAGGVTPMQLVDRFVQKASGLVEWVELSGRPALGALLDQMRGRTGVRATPPRDDAVAREMSEDDEEGS